MKPFGSRELVEEVIRKDLCIGCGACQELCPYFRSYKGKTAMLFACTQDEGRCFAYCPKAEVDLDTISQTYYNKAYDTGPFGRYLSIGIARAGERAGKASFQSGGTVSALMQYALERKIIDGAILTAKDGLMPVPQMVTIPDDVLRSASSKYTAAPTLSILNRAVKDGKTRLGVVSTPCQAVAIAQMRANPMADEAFVDPIALVIGLFCTWSLDYRAFTAFLEDHLPGATVLKIDIPPPPAEVMVVVTDGGTVEFPLTDIRKLIPEACSYCIDMTSEFSDISVGVVEGRPDRNTIICRTARGQQIVEEAVKDGWLILETLPAENIDHLRWAAGNKKRRALAKGMAKGLIRPREQEGFACLRLDKAVLDEITA
jgi:coenzyme F420 hydrogenase subunit beta